MKQTNTQKKLALSSEQLYHHIDPKTLKADIATCEGPILGHEVAKEALRYMIECPGKGQNAYVRGLLGTGRKTLIRQVFSELKPKARQQKDYCYVHNFEQINTPKLIILEAGQGQKLKKMMLSLANYIASDLRKDLNSEEIRKIQRQTEDSTNDEVSKLYEPLEEKLSKDQLILANIKIGNQTQMVIAPAKDGKALSQEEFTQMIAEGKMSEDEQKAIIEKIKGYQDELISISQKAADVIEKNFESMKGIGDSFVKNKLCSRINTISKTFKNKFLDDYLNSLVNDFIDNHLHHPQKNFDPTILYGVNIVNKPPKNEKAPVLFESSPSMINLVGSIEPDPSVPAYASISTGSILNADGGFLILEVDDALSEPSAWHAIINTLSSGYLNLSAWVFENGRHVAIRPEPIPVDIQVILIGSHQRYYQLNAYVGDFSEEFKILADLDTDLVNDEGNRNDYAKVLKRAIEHDDLQPFNQKAMARIIEHAARIASHQEKLTAQISKLIDLAREANYLAIKSESKTVLREHVEAAIKSARKRNAAPARQFAQLLEKGVINIHTTGEAIGQINGLAVSGSSQFKYGFPARITATVAPGRTGLIDIEGQANLSGQIHTKAFQTLTGLLRHLLKPEKPLSFAASVAFEQSYGGIDGDSASGAEACCILSAIAKIPLSQSFAMTGAIDQFGNLQAIGGVNEKIEGFFDCCEHRTLTGEQAVIIPKANVKDLMLKKGVLEAHKKGLFHIYAVDHVLDAFALLTGTNSEKPAFLKGKAFAKTGPMATVITAMNDLYEKSK